MSSSHDQPKRERDDLLERLLIGEAGVDEPEIEALLARDPEARALVADFERLAERLDDAGREARETLDAAAELRGAPAGEERIEPVLRELSAGAPSPSAPRSFSIASRLLAVAAALVLFAGLVWVLGPGSGEPGPGAAGEGVYLGRNRIELLEPADLSVHAWTTFRWAYDLPPGGTYTLEIRDGRADPDADPLVRETDLRESVWTPSSPLPTRLGILVRAHDAAGEPLSTLRVDRTLAE